VFSLGCVYYEILDALSLYTTFPRVTGNYAAHVADKTFIDRVLAVEELKPILLKKLGEEYIFPTLVGKMLRLVVNHMMVVSPKERKNATYVLEAVNQIYQQYPKLRLGCCTDNGLETSASSPKLLEGGLSKPAIYSKNISSSSSTASHLLLTIDQAEFNSKDVRPTIQSVRSRPSLTSSNSESRLMHTTNGHHAPCHRNNNMAYISGAPYPVIKPKRPQTIHGPPSTKPSLSNNLDIPATISISSPALSSKNKLSTIGVQQMHSSKRRKLKPNSTSTEPIANNISPSRYVISPPNDQSNEIIALSVSTVFKLCGASVPKMHVTIAER
jgi:hypothetical protein